MGPIHSYIIHLMTLMVFYAANMTPFLMVRHVQDPKTGCTKVCPIALQGLRYAGCLL